MQFKIASNTKTQKPRRTRLIAVWCARILCWISGSRELVTHETQTIQQMHFISIDVRVERVENTER